MTRLARNATRSAVLAAAVVVGIGAALLPLTAERGEPREIEVVIRGIAFYLDGASAANPVIRVAPGESIALTIRNEETGILHNFAVPDWAAATPRLRAGESHRIILTAPREKGATTYVCTPHAEMMRGTLLVE